jgi:hypothetical protein
VYELKWYFDAGNIAGNTSLEICSSKMTWASNKQWISYSKGK